MSYGGPENTPEDLEILNGATIVSARIMPPSQELLDEFPEFAGDAEDRLVLTVKFRKGLTVTDQDGKEYAVGTFEVWQDVEGNGPGYIAFTGGA